MNLGHLFEVGNAVDKDVNRATTLYRDACKMGNERACGWLIDMCKLADSKARCLELLRTACSAGDSKSCGQLEKLGETQGR